MKENDERERQLCRRKEWNLGNLEPKFSNYLSQLPKPNITSLKDLIDLEVEFAYISGDKYEKQAYGTLTNLPRRILEDYNT